MTLPVRKINRLKNYDYNTGGSYFITICIKERHAILSKIKETQMISSHGMLGGTTHGTLGGTTHGTLGTASPTVHLTEYGVVVEKVLHDVGKNGVNAVIDYYVIMPDHVHFILTIKPSVSQNNAPQAQMVPQIIKWFKRATNKEIGFDIWQRSYHDHVIRSEEEYNNVYQYIQNNPIQWLNR